MLSLNDWMIWLKGLFSAAIGGGATIISNIVIETVRNGQFTTSDLKNTWIMALVNAGVCAALYLKESPLPKDLPE